MKHMLEGRGIFLELTRHQKILTLFDKFEHPAFPVRNRFLRSATHLAASDEKTGALTPMQLGRFEEVAAGGAGTLITGAAFISPEGRGFVKQFAMDCDERIADVASLADAAHKFESKCVVQIHHAGGRHSNLSDGLAPLSPSGLIVPDGESISAPASRGDIAIVISAFADAALRVKEGGADAVQIHGCHGSLLTQFFSPLLNKRDDCYGGSFENRMRIFREVLAAVREKVGSFPVWFKLSMCEGTDGGFTGSDGLALARQLLKDGADAVEVSNGTPYSNYANMTHCIGISYGSAEAPWRDYSKELKKYASPRQLVILTGGLRSLERMSELLDDNAADLFGMSRPFNAEPDLINRWYYDDNRPAACFSCNACLKKLGEAPLDCPIMREKNEGDWDQVPES